MYFASCENFPQVRFHHEIRCVICHSLNIIITSLGLAKNYNFSESYLDYHLAERLSHWEYAYDAFKMLCRYYTEKKKGLDNFHLEMKQSLL